MLLHSLDYVRLHWFPLTGIYKKKKKFSTRKTWKYWECSCHSHNSNVTEHTQDAVYKTSMTEMLEGKVKGGGSGSLRVKRCLTWSRNHKASWLKAVLPCWSQSSDPRAWWHRTLALFSPCPPGIWWQIHVGADRTDSDTKQWLSPITKPGPQSNGTGNTRASWAPSLGCWAEDLRQRFSLLLTLWVSACFRQSARQIIQQRQKPLAGDGIRGAASNAIGNFPNSSRR